jgi:hypothetical protein
MGGDSYLSAMIILIDYHSGMLADAIAAEDHLALISICDPGNTVKLKTGWKHVLEIEFADETRAAGPGTGITEEQAGLIVDFCTALGELPEVIGLIVRSGHSRRRSAALAKALGEWCDLWVNNPGLHYCGSTYQTMRRTIGTRTPPATLKLVRGDLTASGAADDAFLIRTAATQHEIM